MLRGAGASLALPFLEIMQPQSVRAASSVVKPPVRCAFFYIPNGVVQRAWHPWEAGENFALSQTLQPLEAIRNQVSLYTKLDRTKVNGTDGHAQASACWLSSAAPDELSPAGYPLKRTIDQLMAEETGKYTPFRSLELSCNPYEDNRESVYFDNISWYGHGHVAQSQRDPQAVFDRLFSVESHEAQASILDLVLGEANSLNRQLGKVDQEKLAEYLDSVRTVEKQIDRAKSRRDELAGLNLQRPVKPWQAMRRDEFIQVMGDLMVLALQTDLTRVASLMTGPERWSSPLKVEGLFSKNVQHHNMSHNQGKEHVRKELEALDRFHIQQFVHIAQKMDSIQEGEGTLLDNSMFLLGSGISRGDLHVYTDLPTMIAGKGGGKIRTNYHLQSPKGTPIANLWLSMLDIMGIKKESIGDSTGKLKLV